MFDLRVYKDGDRNEALITLKFVTENRDFM